MIYNVTCMGMPLDEAWMHINNEIDNIFYEFRLDICNESSYIIEAEDKSFFKSVFGRIKDIFAAIGRAIKKAFDTLLEKLNRLKSHLKKNGKSTKETDRFIDKCKKLFKNTNEKHNKKKKEILDKAEDIANNADNVSPEKTKSAIEKLFEKAEEENRKIVTDYEGAQKEIANSAIKEIKKIITPIDKYKIGNGEIVKPSSNFYSDISHHVSFMFGDIVNDGSEIYYHINNLLNDIRNRPKFYEDKLIAKDINDRYHVIPKPANKGK